MSNPGSGDEGHDDGSDSYAIGAGWCRLKYVNRFMVGG
jgi:hypothetical protein